MTNKMKRHFANRTALGRVDHLPFPVLSRVEQQTRDAIERELLAWDGFVRQLENHLDDALGVPRRRGW